MLPLANPAGAQLFAVAGGDLVCIEVREVLVSLQPVLDFTVPVVFLAVEAVE